MKKTFAVLLCSMTLAALCFTGIFGCGGSSSSSASASAKKTETATEAVSETPEAAEQLPAVKGGDEFHVGDAFQVEDMKVVYVCSGDYNSDNQFIQPKEGFKYIYLKLYCENIGSSDEVLSSFDFECYADGYSMDQLYLDDSLSASLSAGRTAEGILYFEVPENAEEILVEHSVSLFGKEKFSLVYEGELYSDFVAETNSAVSENAYTVGQTAEGDLSITFVNCYQYDSDNEFVQPKEGYRYVTFEFEVENTSSSDHSISSFSFQCYADGVKCDGCYVRDDDLSATLSSGKKAVGTVSFEVPLGASVIEAEYEDNIWTSSKIIFLFSE